MALQTEPKGEQTPSDGVEVFQCGARSQEAQDSVCGMIRIRCLPWDYRQADREGMQAPWKPFVGDIQNGCNLRK